MTFSTILKTIKREYSFSCCYIADNLSVPDEVVESWEEGTSLPTEEEAIKFADIFSLPRNIVLSTIRKDS